MSFARARCEIVTFPRGATNKGFASFFKKEGAFLLPTPAFNWFRNRNLEKRTACLT
jgi:hypothetical protein